MDWQWPVEHELAQGIDIEDAVKTFAVHVCLSVCLTHMRKRCNGEWIILNVAVYTVITAA